MALQAPECIDKRVCNHGMGAFYQHFLEHVRGTQPWPLHHVPLGFDHHQEQQCADVDDPKKCIKAQFG